MINRGWQVCAAIAFVAAVGGIVILAQACGGGSADVDATPTAATSPTLTAGSETPVPRPGIRPGDGGAAGMPDITPGAGAPGPGFIGGPSEEFAAFLGVSLEQLDSELSAEGATPASVAETHGRSREELKTFFMEQLQAQFSEAVAAGTMSQEDADNMIERSASRIDDVIDGRVPSGGPAPTPFGQ